MKLIVGITGTWGTIYGLRLLAYLKRYPEIETVLIIGDGVRQRIMVEMHWTAEMVARVMEHGYGTSDGIAAVTGGSEVDGVIVAPCSVESLAAIVGVGGKNLLAEAADVCRARGGRVILLVTETPLESEHLELMYRASLIGAVVLPCPVLHCNQVSVEDIVNDAVVAALGLVGIDRPNFRLASV